MSAFSKTYTASSLIQAILNMKAAPGFVCIPSVANLGIHQHATRGGAEGGKARTSHSKKGAGTPPTPVLLLW